MSPDAPARLEAAEKVTGRAQYTSDTELPGQLYAGVLRSRLPHARIVSVSTAAARRVDGVRDVMTPADTRAITWYDEDVPLLGEVARFVGDEIAAVAADSIEAVYDALEAIDVEYDPRDFAADLDAALRDGAPAVHERRPDNRAGDPEIYTRGDIAAGFAAADVVVEATYTTQTALHNALEPHGCNAAWRNGTLELWTSTQGIFAVRKGIARKLGLDPGDVRVRAEHIGGGFGAKQVAWKETLIAALLAKRTGRPVKLMLDRAGECLAAGNRNATRQRVKLGAKHNGVLTAIEADALIDVGAYTVAGEGSDVAGCFQSLYACANVRTKQVRVHTNTGPSVAFRGPGYVEGTFALEQTIDELARRLGLDPLIVRERNYACADQMEGLPYSSPLALERCYDAIRRAAGFAPDGVADSQPDEAFPRRRRGRGFAASNWLAGGGNPPARAAVTVDAAGDVRVSVGTQDIGTGTRTVLAQIAAAELGVPTSRVEVALGDTGPGLEAPTSAGSATLATVGPAVRAAAANAARELARSGAGRGANVSADPRRVTGYGAYEAVPDEVAIRTFAAHYAEVEVDLDTAEVTVLKLICAPDCGRIVNRLLADSQVLGGVTQGLGFALTEERIVDAGLGRVLNANLEDYLVPTFADVPPIEHAPVDAPDPAANPLGVKGLGEPPMIAVAPAIANAIRDATGVRLRDLPMSRRRLLEALGERRTAEGEPP
jgi:xanthine dehydrogenase YagR molybdenum-binding subunit